MPHAIQIRQTAGPEVLNWTPIEVGDPESGRARLRQVAAGLNYIDVYHRAGYYSQLAFLYSRLHRVSPPVIWPPATTQESSEPCCVQHWAIRNCH